MEINIETFRNGDWYIKYFSKEKYAQASICGDLALYFIN